MPVRSPKRRLGSSSRRFTPLASFAQNPDRSSAWHRRSSRATAARCRPAWRRSSSCPASGARRPMLSSVMRLACPACRSIATSSEWQTASASPIRRSQRSSSSNSVERCRKPDGRVPPTRSSFTAAASAGRSRCAIGAQCRTIATTSSPARPCRAVNRSGKAESHVRRAKFERLVADALASIPRRFRDAMANLAIVVEDEPADELLEEMDIEPPDTLLGLYQGTPLTERRWDYGNTLPDRILLFQGPLERESDGEDDLIVAIGETLIHEIGHYFGLSEEEIEEIEEKYWRGDDV